MSKEKACWKRVPPECPVRVPVTLGVELQIGMVEVALGELQGGDGCVRVLVGELEFGSDVVPLEAGAKVVLDQLAQRVQDDLAVGRVVREIVERKPLMAKMLEALLMVLVDAAEGDDRAVLQGITNPQRQEAGEV